MGVGGSILENKRMGSGGSERGVKGAGDNILNNLWPKKIVPLRGLELFCGGAGLKVLTLEKTQIFPNRGDKTLFFTQ